MPWHGGETPGAFPTLGYEVADWVEAHCAIPDGDRAGDPYVLTDDQLRFLLWHYRLHPKARSIPDQPSAPFVYRRSQLVRPQKWGKGPLSAAMICAEAEGPVLFDGWDADGEPVGRPWSTPWIQVTAVSEDQTDNVWRALLPMIELGALHADVPDTGETRVNLPGGGYIEPVTASARSRLGQRITFSVQDETHSWYKTNGGWKLADNQRRNLAGMGGRSLETTNAWDPSEQSVAQVTYETAPKDVFRDYPLPPKGSVRNKRERRRVLKFVYGDSWWIDLDRIEAEIEELLPRDPGQAERFFLNRIVSGADAAFDPETWASLARPQDSELGRKLYAGFSRKDLVVVGFDGARFRDSTGLVVTHVETGHQMVAGVWEKPDSVLGDEWEVDEFGPGSVEEAVEAVFDEWRVWRMYADPPYWREAVDRWAGKYGEKVVVRFETIRTKVMAYSLQAYLTAMETGAVTHDNNEAFARHIANARRHVTNIRDEDGRRMWVIRKERPDSPLKIDLAMAGDLSWEARSAAITAGALKKRRKARGHTF